MKTTLCFILTLLTVVMIMFVPNSFAQDDSPEYVVRFIYFIPKDRQSDPDIDTKLNTLAKDMRKFYADQMEAHGFGRKTFRFETDENGNAKVHHVRGRFNDAYYKQISLHKVGIILDEIAEQFDMLRNIYFISLDISSGEFSDRSVGIGGGDELSGWAVIPASNFGAAIHELGHAFGFAHDPRGDANLIFTSPVIRDPMTTSFCAAEWLNVNRYFNATQETFNHDTKVQMLTPSLVSLPANIRLQFEVIDPDGLHQTQLFIPHHDHSDLIACQGVSGSNTTVEFVTNLVYGSNSIILRVIDKHGNFTWHSFDIDVTGLLPSAEVISIPVPILASLIRREIGLASRDPITQLDMLRLQGLEAVGRQITDLTGLEHAINLRALNLLGNKISDITPLLKLPKLERLSIGDNPIRDLTTFKDLTNLRELSLGGNSITDITFLPSLKKLEALGVNSSPISNISPVWELTQLRQLQLVNLKTKIRDFSPLTKFTALELLNLRGNQIKDITFLTGLTNLRWLFLSNNQISDVSPLSELVNLEELHLAGNPIKNRKPLLELLRKNPTMKIYLEWGGEPLPVTLSHFRAEYTDAGIVLKWITESEVDNAGFYIYRSETRDGDFKVVNPNMLQGAGTTGERNEYTWTDTTAKSNVAYYYRIEDISHAGARKQLATVRMRGLVSASGKLTTRWADLKRQD